MTTFLSVLWISLFVVIVCFLTMTLFLYIYASRMDFDFDLSSDLNPDEEWVLMMDAREGGLSRHWNWD